MPKINANEPIICTKCGTSTPTNLAYRTSSLFIPFGYIPYCPSCLCQLVDMYDIEQVDKLFQYADWPFNPSKWLLLCKAKLHPEAILNTYYKMNIAQLYKEGYTGKVDWQTLNKEYQRLSAEGNITDLLPEKQKEYEQKLRDFWEIDPNQDQYSLSQLEYLQKLYDDIAKTQNVTTGAQSDQAKKLARLSLDMDLAQNHHELELYTKLMTAYTNLVKVAEFTPKSAQSSSSFESMGELVAFLEKTGFINRFYDGEQRDIVDKTIKSQQIFLRRLVSGESNLSERIEQRLQRMNVLDRMEDGTTSEEEWSYDLEKDDDWVNDDNYEEYSDSDEEEDFIVED